ncbi:MAG: hypothetical protein IH984_12180 [Planctomycetes bacterium]|nr:hypothetical protein [Planctomycetota bacterium]
MADRHAKGELAVFYSFMSACTLEIIPNSIRKREPPEPDILCEIQGGSPLAFEISEIVYPAVARRLYSKLELEKQFRETCEKLPHDDQEILKQRSVFVAFNEKASQRAKENIVSTIVQWVIGAGREYLGELTIPNSATNIVRLVRVRQDELLGPTFFVSGAGTYLDTTIETIANKLSRNYEGSSPKELLVFYGIQGDHPNKAVVTSA